QANSVDTRFPRLRGWVFSPLPPFRARDRLTGAVGTPTAESRDGLQLVVRMALEPFTSMMARWYLRWVGDPEPRQRALLRTIVNSCADGVVGRTLGLRPGMTFEEFQDVQPQDYSFYPPFVQRSLEGEDRVFGREPIAALGETSGSTG